MRVRARIHTHSSEKKTGDAILFAPKLNLVATQSTICGAKFTHNLRSKIHA